MMQTIKLSPGIHDDGGIGSSGVSPTTQASALDLGDAARYAQFAPRLQHKIGIDLLKLHEFRGDEHVIDIGSRNGVLTLEAIAPLVPRGRITGIERNPKFAGEAEKLATGQCKFIHADFATTPLPDEVGHLVESADVVFTNTTLHSLYTWDQQANALGIIKALARPGATILMSFAGSGNFKDPVMAAMEVIAQKKWYERFDGFQYPLLLPSAAAWEAFMSQNGFIVDSCELVKDVQTLDVREFVATSLHSFNQRLRPDETAVAEFSEAVAQEFFRRTGHTGPTAPIEAINVVCVARKPE